jgi:hypothetical protein
VGSGEAVPLERHAKGARLDLDRAWVCRAAPSFCAVPFLNARVILEAEGYAPVTSTEFVWLGGISSPSEKPREWVSLGFQNHPPIRLTPGISRSLTIRFRRPQPRTLRIVNPDGAPLPGVSVTAFILLAQSNHMGHPEGDLVVDRKRTDAAGEVSVPDADAEFALLLYKPHYVRKAPGELALVRRLTLPVTTVRLRKMARRPLRLDVQRDGVPQAGLTVEACVAACGGGPCCGRIAVTDAFGRIDEREFYPEEQEVIRVLSDDGAVLWSADPRRLSYTSRLRINLER